MATILLDTEKIDWDLLRLGKTHVVSRFWSEQDSPAWSVICMIDYLQDLAVDQAGLAESDVFGPEPIDVNTTAVEEDE